MPTGGTVDPLPSAASAAVTVVPGVEDLDRFLCRDGDWWTGTGGADARRGPLNRRRQPREADLRAR
ncbi:hypothetical protein GA0070610_6111 [Micromonospora echinofusca]|uniref:Uncharacterized protein n=1 Tax=Micromonospora echinofusca TaxID=47858 RepID=A0A1C5GIX3_MICEH|nr:hypothetical protein GA0070610_6111 [Micromonospora echinofusca]